MAKLKVFEAFAGIGSQRMALRNAGIDFESVGIMEVDRYGLLAYAAIHDGFDYQGELPSDAAMLQYMRDINVGYNFTSGKSELPTDHKDIARLYIANINSKNLGDICKVNLGNLPDMDFFTYSFPCKDFSMEGNRKGGEEGSGTHSALVWECRKIIEAKRPTYLMMENVPGMVDSRNIHILNKWKDVLTGLGYKNYWQVLNAADYGTPQERRRVIMFSILADKHQAPFIFDQGDPIHSTKFRDIMYQGQAPEKFYIDQSQWPCQLLEKATTNMFLDPRLVDGKLKIKGIYPSTYNTAKVIYDPDGGCPTVRAASIPIKTFKGSKSACTKIWDDFGPRALMPIEAWRAQTLSDEDFKKAEAEGLDEQHMVERAGRCICVKMLEAQFKIIFKDYLNA